MRAVAARLGLAVAEKPDSQDICFVPAGRYHDVVAKHRPDAAEPGEIVHLDGRVLGRHEGIARYTVGQGRGLGSVAGRREPLFVTGSSRPPPGGGRAAPGAAAGGGRGRRGELAGRAAGGAAALPGEAPRAGGAARDAEIAWDAAAGLLRVTPDEAAIAAPGQACVLYAGERVLGGGFIRRAMGAVAAGLTCRRR